jgi:hypothetical protein
VAILNLGSGHGVEAQLASSSFFKAPRSLSLVPGVAATAIDYGDVVAALCNSCMRASFSLFVSTIDELGGMTRGSLAGSVRRSSASLVDVAESLRALNLDAGKVGVSSR